MVDRARAAATGASMPRAGQQSRGGHRQAPQASLRPHSSGRPRQMGSGVRAPPSPHTRQGSQAPWTSPCCTSAGQGAGSGCPVGRKKAMKGHRGERRFRSAPCREAGQWWWWWGGSPGTVEGVALPDPWQLQGRCGEERVSQWRREAGLPSTPGPARLWVELWATVGKVSGTG